MSLVQDHLVRDHIALAPGLHARDRSPPRKALFLRELRELAGLAFSQGRFVLGGGFSNPDCDGPSVLLLPGFLGSPASMHILAQALAEAGFSVSHWHLGRNLGVRADTLDRLHELLDEICQRTGAPLSIVGWSLGGVFARELAKRHPDHVRVVLTLGAPFSGDPRANNVWWLYERIAGHPVDRPPVEAQLGEKPPVPTIAFWSRGDGIVAPAAACGGVAESDRRVELDCTHVGYVTDRAAIASILAHLRGE